MTTRRQFLQQSAIVSLSPWLPAFIPSNVRAEDHQRDGRILVVIQLDGGNDGLNTVVPYADELYARHRKELFIPTKNVVKLNEQIGLHPSMQPAADLIQDGRLTIVQGVGYPNPNRSHFESMAIWHHAQPDAAKHNNLGWLGRVADHEHTITSDADSISISPGAIPVALRGLRANAIALANEDDLKLLNPIATNMQLPNPTEGLQEFISRTVHQTYDAARNLESTAPRENSASYPASGLGLKMKLASRLIKMEGRTRIYYVAQPGYDTHAGQLVPHSQLLGEFAGALKAFLNDMHESRLDDRVVVLAFSEFGRRVQENGSAGTDHGAAGPVFLAGKHAACGIVGTHPSLSDLDTGDLKMSIDFRQIYSTLLDSWLGISHNIILGQQFAPLPIISSQALS